MNSHSDNIDGEKRDVLTEIANIGAGHAATALATLLERPIVQSVPNVMLIPLSTMPEQLGGAEKLVVAVSGYHRRRRRFFYDRSGT